MKQTKKPLMKFISGFFSLRGRVRHGGPGLRDIVMKWIKKARNKFRAFCSGGES